jgi:threonine/homoserine/homoserine lactone efflux protein
MPGPDLVLSRDPFSYSEYHTRPRVNGVVQNALLGGGFAFGAAVQPGPLQGFLVARAAGSGWRRTLPACLSPLLSDGPIALVVLLLLGQLSTPAQQLLRVAGGGLLLFFGWKALGQWRRPGAEAPAGSAPRTLVEAALVNVLNPNPYLGWAFVLGPAAVAAWREEPASAVALVVAFYGTMVVTLAAFVLAVGSVRLFGAGARRRLVGVSSFVLVALGAFLLVTGIRSLGAALLVAKG